MRSANRRVLFVLPAMLSVHRPTSHYLRLPTRNARTLTAVYLVPRPCLVLEFSAPRCLRFIIETPVHHMPPARSSPQVQGKSRGSSAELLGRIEVKLKADLWVFCRDSCLQTTPVVGILPPCIHLVPEFKVTEPLTKRTRILFKALDRLSEAGVSVSKSYNMPDAAFGHNPAQTSVDCTVWYTPEGHVLCLPVKPRRLCYSGRINPTYVNRKYRVFQKQAIELQTVETRALQPTIVRCGVTLPQIPESSCSFCINRFWYFRSPPPDKTYDMNRVDGPRHGRCP